MYYRMRTYYAADADHEVATRIFKAYVQPVHERHGAQLVGRWLTEDRRLVVIWAYPDEAACAQTLEAVRTDPVTRSTQAEREATGLASFEREEVFMTSTL
ncbi:MAG: NIPSNAP family protein [Bacteroidota bacterium]